MNTSNDYFFLIFFLFTTDIARTYPKTKSSSAPMAKTAIEGRRSLQIYLASKDNHMSFKQQKTPKFIYILHHFTKLMAHKILIMLHVIFFV